MKQFAAAFLLASWLAVIVTFIWMTWSDKQVADKAAFTALIIFANALLICLAML
ncbi:hypothetical protein [Limosilactobacillus mucosae]|uniref:hypothetical protein n=1 Tax=Limosilactobacillus mucosae TaxID=97478 RepID=UPI0013E8B285|nr:hypothetical protein [Limosilactobacillus mucosae]